MFRRIAIACVALVALMGASDAIAKKRPKPKIKVGEYVGTTTDGIPLTVTLDPGRASGSIAYCSQTAPFTVNGKSFTVFQQDPLTLDTINSTGTFHAKRRRSGKVSAWVSGTMEPNGCDSVPQTYRLKWTG
jgi:hypothetical protein